MGDFEYKRNSFLNIDKEVGFDLWQEHARVLRSWDDLSLMRWLNQTLGQLQDRTWRVSHPLVMAYRLGTTVAYQRDLWNRRTFSIHEVYERTSCCGAPFIPLVSLDICTQGIYCSCCGDILLTIENLEEKEKKLFHAWGMEYELLQRLAQKISEDTKHGIDCEKIFEDASQENILLLSKLGYELTPLLLKKFPVVLWEDSDPCFDIIPEDISPPLG